MFNPQEEKLIHAADRLRQAIETDQCSYFESLLSINNLYFLHLCQHVEHVSFARLEQAQETPVTPHDLKLSLIETCHNFGKDERRSAPFVYETKQAAFLNNLAQMLNTPFFENEPAPLSTPLPPATSSDPAMIFTRVLWDHYAENWDRNVASPHKPFIDS